MKYGEIYWVDLPNRSGHEQRGNRPAIVWQDTEVFPLPTVLIIPLTGQREARRFKGALEIQTSPSNGLPRPWVALVIQLGACDVRRVGSRIRQMDEADLTRLRELAKALQKLY